MKKLQFSLFVILFLILRQATGFAQQQFNDESQIRTTLLNYIEGRNDGDLERLKRAFHPGAALKFVQPGNGAMGEWSLEEYLARLEPGKKQNCSGEITDIRIFSDAAQATVVLTYPNMRFHDYMSLLKIDGQWLIVDKIFARKTAEEATSEANAAMYKGKKSDEYGYDMKLVKIRH